MNVLTRVRQHIILNIKFYGIIAFAFFVGVFVAFFSVFNMDEAENKELMLYLGDFFANITQTGTDGLSILKISVLDNLKGILFAVMFSLMIIGAPFVGLICAVFGYMSAFTVFVMLKNYGIRAILFFLAGMLPHWLILLPTYAFFMMECMKFSLKAVGVGTVKRQGSSLLELMLLSLLVFLISLCAALLEAYIEPWLISFVSKYYI